MGKTHAQATEGELHQLHDAEFADRDEREAYSYASTDIGKLYYQTDENSYWMLLSTTPTFAKVSIAYGEETNTADATSTVIWSFTMPDNSAMFVDAKVTAMQSDGSDRGIYHLGACFYRDGGNATQQGSTVNYLGTDIESDATVGGVSFTLSTNDVRVSWSGKASENWVVTPEVQYSLTVD